MTTKLFTEVDAKAAQQLLNSPTPPLLIDVREQNEWDAGYLHGATHAPKGMISFTIANIAPEKSAPILLYCAGGVRSAAAAETLAGLGYTNLTSMAGGINGWSAAGLPVVETTTLTPEQKSRYSRHLLLPGVGADGQTKLLNARVLMVGAGGLGAPAALSVAGLGGLSGAAGGAGEAALGRGAAVEAHRAAQANGAPGAPPAAPAPAQKAAVPVTEAPQARQAPAPAADKPAPEARAAAPKPREAEAPKAAGPLACVVSRLTEQKGLDLLLETLRAVSPAGLNDPTVVVLTPGMYNSAYFEHAFLAQQMGVELVEGQDLFVKDAYVYMRTTRGPKRIDVIYRRVDDDFLDPSVFLANSTLGCSGLMEAYKAGHVAVCNAIGTGVADDKSIYPFVPKMIEFYLGEKPILNNVPTYTCRNADDLKYTLANLPDLVVKQVHGAGGYGMLVGPASTQAEIADFREALLANPSNYVAQPTLSLSTCPTYVESGVAPRHIDLRPFVLSGKTVQMMVNLLLRTSGTTVISGNSLI